MAGSTGRPNVGMFITAAVENPVEKEIVVESHKTNGFG
jgi:hypothetical protein